ncbi:MAG: extracellular solute-binding protein family 5, partial [Bacteroidetes bacterium]|nr:extracellular solute-binding protein family 5 [Bacteroidota bacterium]
MLADFLHPARFILQRSTNALVRSLIYEGLTEVTPSLEAVPSLAESWTVSKDGKEYTFRLRKGVIFHDGKEMEAEDVKWSLETILEPKNRAFMRATLSAVAKVEAMDRFLLKLTLKEPFAPLLTIALSGDTIILPKGSIPAGASLTSPLPGTGPFQFIEWRERNQITLRAHKKYRQRGTPYLDEVIIRPVPSDDVRFLALRSGDVDLIEVVPYPMVNEVKKGKYPEIRLAPAPIAGFRMFKMNVEAPHFSNPKVRRAVALAVDRKAY